MKDNRPDKQDRAIFWIVVFLSALTAVLAHIGVI